MALKIRKIETIERPNETYNLHVKTDHNYVANGLVTQNCHLVKAASLVGILEKCRNAEYRIGMTGSLPKDELSKLTIKGLFGKTFTATTTNELQKKKLLADLTIKCIKLNYDEKEREIVKKLEYPKEMKYLVEHGPRNEFISSLAKNQTGNTLVLFNTIEHGKMLHKLIEKKIESDEKRKVFLIYGKVPGEERERIRQIVSKEKDAIIVASFATFSTGINIPSITSLIFAIGSKSSIRVIQSIGRGLRISPDGKSTILYDIVDDLSWKSRENYALRHAADRVAIYIQEKFEFKLTEIDFSKKQ